MPISVQVRGHTARYFPEGKDQLTVPWPGEITVRQLLERLGVDHLLIMRVNVNGTKVTKDHILADGDEVLFFSPPAGG